MNALLWDSFVTDNVNDKTRYWVDLWETMIDNRMRPQLGVSLEILNPHLLVRHIIDEIVFNNFQNPEHRASFQRALDHFMKHDPATKKLFATDLALIRREFGGSRFAYLLQLCRTVDEAYSNSRYLDELFLALRSVLSAEPWQDSDTEIITTISQCMIVELLLTGYSLETIRQFPANVFARHITLHFAQFPVDLAAFFSDVEEETFVSDGQLDVSAYLAAIQAAADAMTVEQRLNLFATYFSPRRNTVFFLYQIQGLKGQDLDITIGNVNLYSPTTKRYIKTVPGDNPDKLTQDELFGSTEEQCFANAAVTLDEFDLPSAERQAITAIEKTLDFFRVFVSSDVPFNVMGNKFIRVSPDGDYLGGGERSRSRSDPAFTHLISLDLSHVAKQAFDDQFLSSAATLLFDTQHTGGMGERLAYSLHWYRKAEEAETPEDRLLCYWIVLENVISVEKAAHNVLLPENTKESKFSLVRELVSTLECCVFLRNAASMLFRQLLGLLGTSTNGRPHLTLPEALAAESGLNCPPGASTDVATFVAHLPAIAAAIDRKTVKDVVEGIHKLHNDKDYARQQISQRLHLTSEDLLIIYRYRNRIVHNARYDDTVLPYYIEKARHYAGTVLRQVLHDICSRRERSVEQSLMRYYVGLRRIEEKLAKGVSVDFLRWDV